MGTIVQMTPIMVRGVKLGADKLRSHAIKLSAALGSATLIWGAVLLLVPDKIGVALLGQSWDETLPLLPTFSVYYLTVGLAAGAITGLRALGAARTSLRIRLLVAPLSVGLGLAGVVIGGARDAVLGLAIASSIGLPLWWWALTTEIRGHVELAVQRQPTVN